MTPMIELPNGDLQLEDGTIIPASKRQKTEVYSRIVGYLRPISSWNKGKKAEWRDRVVFNPEAIDAIHDDAKKAS